jgi:hypothetical protein
MLLVVHGKGHGDCRPDADGALAWPSELSTLGE